jgi:hypothetical protein
LIAETGAILRALASGAKFDVVRQAAMNGDLFQGRTRVTREGIWQQIQFRLFAHDDTWLLDELQAALHAGEQSDEFRSLLYFVAVLRDRFAFDVVVDLLWPRWLAGNTSVVTGDALGFLERSIPLHPEVANWTDSTRRKVAGNVLTTLRDFGLLRGAVKKSIIRPVMPDRTASAVLRVLVEEGKAGQQVIDDPTWRLFLCREVDVNDVLLRLARQQVVRFERTGGTVLLETPAGWRGAR